MSLSFLILEQQPEFDYLAPKLATRFPDSTVIVVHNDAGVTDRKPLPSPFQSVWPADLGLHCQLHTGYQAYIDNNVDQPLIRICTDEYSVKELQELAEVSQPNLLRVVDLRHDQIYMRTESADCLADKLTRLYFHTATRGQLSLGFHHGLLVYPSPTICHSILDAADEILAYANIKAGHQLNGGFYEAMVLGAVANGFPVEVVIEGASRPCKKLVEQLYENLQVTYQVFKAAAYTFPTKFD